jgi:hypothetical protein
MVSVTDLLPLDQLPSTFQYGTGGGEFPDVWCSGAPGDGINGFTITLTPAHATPARRNRRAITDRERPPTDGGRALRQGPPARRQRLGTRSSGARGQRLRQPSSPAA